MSTIISNYPVFEDSQVLTSGQLNQLIKYLDQQNRLTRVTLIGMGIVCGMKIKCETVDSATSLTISEGVGVTSEGFLITIGECTTTRYRIYNKPDSVSYPPFEAEGIELFELLTEEASTDPEEVITDLDESFLSDKIVLLYLECYDKDLKSCLGKSCDELGIDRIFTLRKLVITEDQLKNLVWPETGGNGKADASFPGKFQLPANIWLRPLFQPEVDTYYEMCIQYLNAMSSDTFLQSLSESYNVYEPVLQDLYEGDPFTSSKIQPRIDDITEYIQHFSMMTGPVYGVQYLYDFVKDLALAYEEFRQIAFELSSVCCPDMDRFPKHLMLGQACETEDENCGQLEFRNEFVSSPALNQQEYLLDKVRFLHKRMVLLIESFDLGRLKNPEDWPLKITPSCEKKGTLSQRSIPYYYDSKKQSAFEGLGTLEDNWNFDIYRRCFESDHPQQISYDNHEFDNPPEHPVTTPLGYDLDQFNFLRIEGILAKPVDEVAEQIQEARRKWGLSFELKTVHFGDLLDERPSPDCLVADLQPDYAIWRNKMLLFLNNLVRTSKTVEKTVKHRKAYGESLNNITREEAAEAKSRNYNENIKGGQKKNTMFDAFFEKQRFSGITDSSGRMDYNKITRKLYEAEIELSSISRKSAKSKSAAFESAEDKSISGLFNDLNNCLLGLIHAMPMDFRDFSMEEWLSKYKCIMRVYIELMKFMVTYASSNLTMMRIMIILIIMCYIFVLIKFLAIYPYITIRTLYDTLQERIDQLVSSLEFSGFMQHHPGMEHKAGVAPGQTFVLVYQALHDSIDDLERRFEEEKRPELIARLRDKKMLGSEKGNMRGSAFEAGKLHKAIEEMQGRVVADFTLPFICCDDCADLPHTPLPLDPLVSPVCGHVSYADQKMSEYRSFKRQMLNDLYDPEVYKVTLTSDPLFGSTTLEETVYDPDPNKTSQTMEYVVDMQKIENEKEVNDAYIFIDEFEYEVKDVTQDEIVGKDKITIFIPVVREELASVQGSVTTIDESGNQVAVAEATVSVSGTNLQDITNSDGTYEIQDVPPGDQLMVASHEQLGVVRQEVKITSGKNTVDFVFEATASLYGTVNIIQGDYIQEIEGSTIELYTSKNKEGAPAYIQSTGPNGAYNFSNILPGDYVVVARYPGYEFDEKSVSVGKTATSNQNFTLKAVSMPDLKMDRYYDEMKIDPVSPEAKSLREHYASKYNSYEREAVQVKKKMKGGEIYPLDKTEQVIKEFTRSEEVNVIRLNNEYNNQRNELVEAWRKSSGEEKELYAKSLQVLTVAYLDRLALTQPETLTDTSRNVLKESATIFESNKGLNMGPVLRQWSDDSRGYVTDEFNDSVEMYFNLK